mmetsp:Transcript_112118/g.347957  ORF Transcript_112118/g.347957 Transcript_112118/m.347957 type:complete len:542 (-) Transcript_112118:44-1669(-)
MAEDAKKCLDNGDVELAIKKALEAMKAVKGEATLADTVKVLVAAHIAADRLDDAKVAVRDAMSKFKASGNKAGEVSMLLATADLYCAEKEPEKALDMVSEVQALLPATGGQASALEAQMLNMQVAAYLQNSNSKEAMVSAKELRALASKDGDKAGEAAAWNTIASVYAAQEEEEVDGATPDSAVEAAEKAMSIYKETGDKKGEASSLVSAARARIRQEKVARGIKDGMEALDIYRDLSQTRGMVSALETLMQAYAVEGNPMAGIRAANKELETVAKSGNLRGQVDLLEMIAQNHAMLGQPRGAMTAAKQALAICTGLGDNLGQGSMLHTMAEMLRAMGDMQEATMAAEQSLKAFKAAGCKWGEEQALQTISSLFVQRGLPEKAPKRGDVQKALKELQKAIEQRKVEEFKAAEEKLNSMEAMIGTNEVQDLLMPILTKDASAVEFLEEQGWQFKTESTGATIVKNYPHKGFYLQMIMTGMNFGPQFRSVNPYRVGNPGEKGKDCTCISVSQLPETEAWQMELGYRPGILDAGLQCQAQMSFP